MKNLKKIAFLAVAAIAPAMLALTSCSKDDNKDAPVAPAKEVAGNYTGTLDVAMAGNSMADLSGKPATIKVTQTDQTVTLQLTKSALLDTFFGGQPIGAKGVIVSKNTAGVFTLSGTGKVSMGDTSLDITVAGTGIPAAMVFTITVPEATVVATFTGSMK